MKKFRMLLSSVCMTATLATAVPMSVPAAVTSNAVATETSGETSDVAVQEEIPATKKLSVKYQKKTYVKKATVTVGNKKVKKTVIKSSFSYPVIANKDKAAKKIQAYFDQEYKEWLKTNKSLKTKDWKEQYYYTPKADRKYMSAYNYSVSYELSYNTDDFFTSFIRTADSYLGGAHGSHIVTGATFFRETGSNCHYPIGCVEANYTPEDFKQKIYKAFAKVFDANMKKYGSSVFYATTKKQLKKDVYDYYDCKVGKEKEPFAFRDCFYLKKNKDGSTSMVFIANQYELGPYASGTLTAEIIL